MPDRKHTLLVEARGSFGSDRRTAKREDDWRVARIQDTKNVETFWASEHLIPELLDSGRVEVTGDLRPIAFDAAGMFVE